MYYYCCSYPYAYQNYAWGQPQTTNTFVPIYQDVRYRFSSQARENLTLKDYGPDPYVVNINEAAKQNQTFRTALWTGEHLQVTLMSIDIGDEIGLEIHPDTDQFLRIGQGRGIVRMGKERNNLNFRRRVYDDSAIMVPAGYWHNVKNTGNVPLKLYSIYAPPHHPHGTVHTTKKDAIEAEDHQ